MTYRQIHRFLREMKRRGYAPGSAISVLKGLQEADEGKLIPFEEVLRELEKDSAPA